ncbi:YHS domain-containing (seleno)protein [Phaeobacter sp.]|uniref:YHS domain-containing (seleno)protein n=1 Tax=Phaeobacter sp. TaxID=1902409 RepID=UPI0025D84608|nr:YHS domain-containing (seleno)protein [Phaeobacter sp.]
MPHTDFSAANPTLWSGASYVLLRARTAALSLSGAMALSVGLGVVMLGSALGPAAAQPALVSQSDGLAAGGHDVVSFFAGGQPRAGTGSFAIKWRGAMWRFHTADNLARFESNPHAYAPQFGGYCAYALAQGVLKPGDPTLFVISDGRLYLLNNREAMTRWQSNQRQHLTRAEARWPQVLRD